MDLKNQIELELYFADHFDTILFPDTPMTLTLTDIPY